MTRPPDRTAFHVASLVRGQLVEHQIQQDSQLLESTRTLADNLNRFFELHRKLGKAQTRGWHGAARRIRSQLTGHLQSIAGDIHYARDQLTRQQRPPTLPSLRQMLDELEQIEDELGPWRYDRRRSTLLVTTESIELEGVHLGPFTIELSLDRLNQLDRYHAYSVIAQDPHPAAGSEQVTHPHVSDDGMCEGEATSAIRAALATGRLADSFMLVNAVLHTYNESSPYVPLSEWDCEGCWECGERAETESCDLCGHAFCSSDSFFCERTSRSVCYGCGEGCEEDRAWYHPEAIKTCSGCDRRVMDEHLDDSGLTATTELP